MTKMIRPTQKAYLALRGRKVRKVNKALLVLKVLLDLLALLVLKGRRGFKDPKDRKVLPGCRVHKVLRDPKGIRVPRVLRGPKVQLERLDRKVPLVLPEQD